MLVRASGALIERDLQPGEVLRISSGCLVAFEPTVHYDITTMKGIKNVVFGGEGLFVTTLTGPGKIYLQSLPFDRVVGELASRIPSAGGGGMMFPFMMGGGGGSNGGGEGSDGSSAGAGEAQSADADAAAGSTDEWNVKEGDDIYGGSNSQNIDGFDSGTDESFADAAEGEDSGGILDFFDSLFRKD